MARILIVEDDSSTATFLRDLITKSSREKYNSEYDISYDVADNAPSALQLMESRNYELVITDILMARMDGWEFIKRLRETHCRSMLPIIVVSAVSSVNLSFDAVASGANDGFVKPLKGAELARFVKVVFNLIAER